MTMTKTNAQLPAARFDLAEVARFDHNGAEFVVYYDGGYTDVVEADDFDAETTESDYNEWCHDVGGLTEAIYKIAACHVNDAQGFTSGAHATVTPFENRAEAEAMIRDYYTTAITGIEGTDGDVMDYAAALVRLDGEVDAADYDVTVTID